MAARQSTPDSHSDNVRKRVCKACDRCRLKKSKCDGSSPCSRCRADNAVCVFGERKKAHDKVYPKGYVEMLEQQQAWLVHGLQEMYRRSIHGEGWPGDRLKPEPNGHPLTHDLLTRLGALDHSKGEHFEENPDALQRDLWRHGLQRQDSSDASSESAQSPVSRTFPSSSSTTHQTLPPTPPAYSPSSARGPVKPEPVPDAPQFAMPAMPGVVNPLALQGPQHWSGNGFNLFDEMDLMPGAEYSNLSFDESMASPMFPRQMPMNCVPNEYDDFKDFNQYLNPNPTEITSI